MNAQGFVREIVNRYHEARKPICPHTRIFRGESRSISSEAEDILAFYLVERLPNCEIYINQTITTGNDAGRVRLKPDLVVVQDKIIHVLLDLKMDLGYKRKEFPEFWDKYDALFRVAKVALQVDRPRE